MIVDTDFVNEIRKKGKDSINTEDLAQCSKKIRKDIVEMVYLAASGHPGGALGLTDIFTVLYLKFLNQSNTDKYHHDRFLISNGHVCAVQYASMALVGLIPEEELKTFRKLGSRLQGHPSTHYLPMLANSSGSLGQGLSQACGEALGKRLQNHPGQVYICISDGECDEGMTWEAAMSVAHYKLDNISAFVDYNHIQIDGRVEDVMNLGDLSEKFRSFGWLTKSANGHDFNEIIKAFEWSLVKEGKPKIILFETTLGKGVSFMENNPKWHGSPPSKEDFEKAIEEIKNL